MLLASQLLFLTFTNCSADAHILISKENLNVTLRLEGTSWDITSNLLYSAGTPMGSDIFDNIKRFWWRFYNGGRWDLEQWCKNWGHLSTKWYCTNILYNGEISIYVLVFIVYLGMPQILTDLPIGCQSESQKCQKSHGHCSLPVGKSVNIWAIPWWCLHIAFTFAWSG